MGFLVDFWLLKVFRGVSNAFETIFSEKNPIFLIFSPISPILCFFFLTDCWLLKVFRGVPNAF